MANILEMLAYSGPLPIEDVLWRAGETPSAAIQRIIEMAGQGLVAISGVTDEQLRDLMHQVQHDVPDNADVILRRIHDALAHTNARIELTGKGLRSVPAVV